MSEKAYHYEDPQLDTEVQAIHDSIQPPRSQRGRRVLGEVLLPQDIDQVVTSVVHARAAFVLAAESAGMREITVKLYDVAGAPVGRSVVTFWMSSSSQGPPSALSGSYSLISGDEILGRSGYLAIQAMTSATGKLVVEVTPGSGDWHFMVSSGPFISASGAATWI